MGWVKDRLELWLLDQDIVRARLRGLEARIARLEEDGRLHRLEIKSLKGALNLVDAREKQRYHEVISNKGRLTRLKNRLDTLELERPEVVYLFGKKFEVKA